jgi:serine/threonine-protein kinase RsbW
MPDREPGTEQIRVVIPSRLDLLGILNNTISELGEYLTLEEEVVDALAIAVIEAGTNAIQHGSPDPRRCQVDFLFDFSDHDVRVEVRDQGPGFDLSRVIDEPPGADRLLESRGRGIFLMRSFMDEVEFVFNANGGTVVRMRKRRPARNGAGD